MRSRERRRFVVLVLGIALSSIWNIGGIASIMPFMQALAAPESFGDNRIAGVLMQVLQIETAERFLVIVGIIVLLLFVTGNIFLALVTWGTIRFARAVGYSLSSRLFGVYMEQPYPFFLQRNSSELTKNLLNETNNVTGNIVKPMMELIVEGFLSSAIIVFLILVNPVVAIVAALLLGGAYSGIFFFFRRALARAGKKRVKRNRERYGLAADAFGAIKEIKLRGLEEPYSSVFAAVAYRFERAKAAVQTISKLPKYALEVFAFGGMLAIALVIFANERGTDQILPLISAYAFAGYRLMPSLQKFFAAFTTIRGNTASLDVVIRELSLESEKRESEAVEPLGFERSLVLDQINFAYAETSRPAISGITFQIEKNTTVGIAGPTGCGKTTLVDVILGLLLPQSGELRVDGVGITADNRRAWQRNFGYVPQSIYLSDTTLRSNIAFGVPEAEIDDEQVRFAARLANLADFVETLDEGYETTLGERGVRMSGGQRQRVGIARALYHEPQILVFDEATSALDSQTEQAVMGAIENLMHKKTILMIAHRLSTLRQCDSIVVLKDGYVDAMGRYEQLKNDHPHFTDNIPE